MILCCGEALIDMLPRRTAAGEAGFAPCPGGAVFNTAVALGRLGARAGLFSGLSDDLFGEMLQTALAASRVDTAFAVTSARPTTLAFVALQDGQASYAFYDENTAGRMLTPADLPALPTDISTLFFGGISLVAEPCGGTYEALLTREAGTRVTMLDPNIRPAFITDQTAYRARIARMMALADIVKFSDEDLHWFLGTGELDELAQGLLAGGPKVVLLTEGAKGARAFTGNGAVSVAAAPVDVADTVGAGDTFNAGFLASLHRAGALTRPGIAGLADQTLENALKLGVRAAGVTVSRAGANPPWENEL